MHGSMNFYMALVRAKILFRVLFVTEMFSVCFFERLSSTVEELTDKIRGVLGAIRFGASATFLKMQRE